jgi:hypothetical protein
MVDDAKTYCVDLDVTWSNDSDSFRLLALLVFLFWIARTMLKVPFTKREDLLYEIAKFRTNIDSN